MSEYSVTLFDTRRVVRSLLVHSVKFEKLKRRIWIVQSSLFAVLSNLLPEVQQLAPRYFVRLAGFQRRAKKQIVNCENIRARFKSRCNVTGERQQTSTYAADQSDLDEVYDVIRKEEDETKH